MKTSQVLLLAGIGAAALFFLGKQKEQEIITEVMPPPPQPEKNQVDNAAVINYALADMSAKTTTTKKESEYAKAQGAGYTLTESGFTSTKTSSVGRYFDTGKTTSSGTKLIGYASSKVTSIKTVPKEQSIAYKLGYIK